MPSVCYTLLMLPDSTHVFVGIKSAESRGDAWKTLQDWISDNFTCDHDCLRNSTVVFGTGNTYYAKTPTGCLWNNIPHDLEKAISEHMTDRGPPSDVCLGVNETWAVLWDNGKIEWNLKSNYDTVHKHLSADADGGVAVTRIVLDPYSSDFFLHFKTGLICWSVQFEESGRKSFVQRCQAYMQERANEDGRTFELEHWRSGDQSSKSGYIISPSTNWGNGTEDTIRDKVLKSLTVPDAWSEKLRQTTASSGWSWVAWSGAAVAGGVFSTAVAIMRGSRRFFKKKSIVKSCFAECRFVGVHSTSFELPEAFGIRHVAVLTSAVATKSGRPENAKRNCRKQ
jgi:hypothetical protein